MPYDRRAVNGRDLGALSTEEGYAAVTEYAIRHPLVARVLERAFGFEITRSEAARRAFSVSVALVGGLPPDGGLDEASEVATFRRPHRTYAPGGSCRGLRPGLV